MDIEFEATFANVDKGVIRSKLKEINATLVRKEFLMKRVTFNLPKGHEIDGGWARVRDEGDKITLSLKVIDGDQIHNQKEIFLEVDSFESGELLLDTLGCKKKSFQESKRELWKVGDVEVTIDEWPFLEPFVEVEGLSESVVRSVSEKLGFDYSTALFCAVGKLYEMKYGITEDAFNYKVPRIVFDGDNVFV